MAIALRKINSERYGALLVEALPRVIRTGKENDEATSALLELEERADRLSPEERELMELLVVLIQDFEDRHYPMNQSEPRLRLLDLMEDRGITQAELSKIIGSRSTASDILCGRRSISKAMAKKLSTGLRVPVEVFL